MKILKCPIKKESSWVIKSLFPHLQYRCKILKNWLVCLKTLSSLSRNNKQVKKQQKTRPWWLRPEKKQTNHRMEKWNKFTDGDYNLSSLWISFMGLLNKIQMKLKMKIECLSTLRKSKKVVTWLTKIAFIWMKTLNSKTHLFIDKIQAQHYLKSWKSKRQGNWHREQAVWIKLKRSKIKILPSSKLFKSRNWSFFNKIQNHLYKVVFSHNISRLWTS